MKVNRILKPSEVDEMVKAAGREPQQREGGAVTDADIEALNKKQNRAQEIEKRLNAPGKQGSDSAKSPASATVSSTTFPQQGGGESGTTSVTKLNKKLVPANDLARKMPNFIKKIKSDESVTVDNFGKKLIDELGLREQRQASKYAFAYFDKDNTVTLRVSDHEGNARNIIITGVKTDRGVSIVLKTPDSPDAKFKPNNWANVDEYVYNNPF